MAQIERAVCIAEFNYPPVMHTLVWLFDDQSSCHRACASDALINNMNVRPGGAPASSDERHGVGWQDTKNG